MQYLYLGWFELMTIPAEDQANHLTQRNAEGGLWLGRIGRVHLLQSRIGEANIWLEKARNPVPAALLTRSRPRASFLQGREKDRH
jgi:hypothetical protein